jgi:hypothetical protein
LLLLLAATATLVVNVDFRAVETATSHPSGELIFTFEKSVSIRLGRFSGHGLLDRDVAGIRAFVMAGPYASTAAVDAALEEPRGHAGSR